ncbi:MAG TPA: hypothetical protein VHH73_07610, partial [Verrucomicrobiae bacterium]|nr:hypothetical protein [Verrucomicrobiae bacterium]
MIDIPRQITLPLVCLACLVNVPGTGANTALADDKEASKPAAKTEPARAEAKPDAADWKPLFDGKTLKGWRMTEFGGGTEPRVENGEIRIDAGSQLAGIT